MKYIIIFKVKYYYVVIIKLCLTLSTNAQLFLNSNSETGYSTSKCGSIVFDNRPKTHTIILDTSQDNWSLSNCLNLLKEDIDRMIFTGSYVLNVESKTKLKHFLDNRPNIVIFTRNLSSTILFNSVADVLLQSHWSLVNIVVVDNETFTCENGYFGMQVNATIYNFLNKLWKRYEIVHVVVEYPTTCPNRFSTYDGNKMPSENVGQLYERTITTVDGSKVHETLMKSNKNLAHGYPLKANIFYRFPTSITECENLKFFMIYNKNLTNGYCGVDALVMQDIMQIFKFNTSFLMLETPTYYGYVQAGRATGSLGSVVRGEIDISFNSRFMVSYLVNSFEFLYYIWFDSLCALMKEPSAVPLWHYPFNCFTPINWMITLSSLTFVGLLMYIRSKITVQFGGYSFNLYVYIVNAIWSGLLGFFFNKRIQRSLLATTCLLSSLVITARYQGHVNYMFATLVRYDRLRTLKDMCDNGVQVYTAPSIAVLLNSDYRGCANNHKTRLIQNFKYYPINGTTTGFALKHPNIATLERADVLLQTLVKFRDSEGKPLLYTVDESFQDYYLSYIVRSGFLFTSELKVLIMKIVEAGLPAVYHKWTRYTFIVLDHDSKKITEPRPSIKISLQEQKIPFLLLLLGYVVSIVIFGVELCRAKRARRAMDDEVLQNYLE